LELTDGAYIALAARAHALAHEVCGGALVLLGGGGYAPLTVARVWTHALATIGGFRMLARDG
jgi:acetoin utilization deacetylase AcuC-like enzyme